MSAAGVTDRWPSAGFRWLWASSGTSLLGSEIGDLAIPLFALLTLGADAGELAALRTAQFAPFLVLTLAIGVVVDRVRRRRLLIVSHAVRALVLAGVVAAALAWQVPVWALVLAVFALGSLTVSSQLADFSLLPAVVPTHRLADANSRLASTQSAMSIAGSGVGGTTVQVLTAPVALAATACAYVAASLMLLRVPADDRPSPGPAERVGPWRQARAGLTFLRRDPVLRALALEAATWNFANEILLLGLTLHVMAHYRWGAALLGGLLMASGAGAVAGALVSGLATRRFGYGPSLSVALVVGNSAPLALVGTIASPSNGALAVAVLAFVVSGVGIGVANAQAVTVRQLATPPDLLGRVNAAYRFLTWGMLAVGAMAAGGAVTAWGPEVAILAGAIGTTLASAWVLASPVRRLRGLES